MRNGKGEEKSTFFEFWIMKRSHPIYNDLANVKLLARENDMYDESSIRLIDLGVVSRQVEGGKECSK